MDDPADLPRTEEDHDGVTKESTQSHNSDGSPPIIESAALKRFLTEDERMEPWPWRMKSTKLLLYNQGKNKRRSLYIPEDQIYWQSRTSNLLANERENNEAGPSGTTVPTSECMPSTENIDKGLHTKPPSQQAAFPPDVSSSSGVYYSARGSDGGVVSNEELSSSIERRLRDISNTEYAEALRKYHLLSAMEMELNWSGRRAGTGQHVEFGIKEKIPLKVCGLLGEAGTARVEKVKCRRIFLARKSIKCNWKLKLSDVAKELDHLQNLRHAHIIQLIGSYIQGKTFAILLYPVADGHLSDFMQSVEHILASKSTDYHDFRALQSIGRFVTCLTHDVSYIHESRIKHMDIKPQNILVKQSPAYKYLFMVYIADFGFSRSFSNLEHSRTESNTAMTRKYCAPEVARQELRGRSADVFSLGTVFLEMLTVLCGQTLDDLHEYQSTASGLRDYHETLPLVHEWIDKLHRLRPIYITEYRPVVNEKVSPKMLQAGWPTWHETIIDIIRSMIQENPDDRPPARRISEILMESGFSYYCCSASPEPLAEDSSSNSDHGDPIQSQIWRALYVLGTSKSVDI